MIGAGMLHNDFVQVSNATENAVGWLDYGLHETGEGKNVQDAFKIWADSKEAQDFMKVAEYFPESPEGKPLFNELEAAGHVVHEHGSFGQTEDPHSHFAHLSNEGLAKVGHHLEQAGHHYDALEGTDVRVALPYLFEQSMKTAEGTQLERFAGDFHHSEAVQNAKGWAEHAMNHSLEHGYFFDVPEEIKGDLTGAGLHVYKQRYVKVSDLPNTW